MQVEAFLDRQRHAVQWPERFAALAFGVGLLRFGAGRLVTFDYDSIQFRIDLLDTPNVGFDDFNRRSLAARNEAG